MAFKFLSSKEKMQMKIKIQNVAKKRRLDEYLFQMLFFFSLEHQFLKFSDFLCYFTGTWKAEIYRD